MNYEKLTEKAIESSIADDDYIIAMIGGALKRIQKSTLVSLLTPDSVAKLTTARALEGVLFDGSAARHHYGTCSTSGATAAKTCSITGFSLVTGARVIVRFSYANTAANPTLNVSSTGAKAIRYKNATIPKDYIQQYTVLELVYSGSYWYVVGTITQSQIDALKAELDLLVSPETLWTGTAYASSLNTYAYTTVSGLSNWKEVRMFIEVGDGSRQYHTFTRDANTVIANAYVGSNYYGCVQVLCDFDNNRIGVYTKANGSWGLSTIRVTRVEGLVKN